MDVLMPQLGETVAEGKITQWFKSAGDAIKPGDNLFEIETDKVSMEVPSTSAGVLAEIRVAAGEVAPVGAVVAVIADGAGAKSAIAPSTRSSAMWSLPERGAIPPPFARIPVSPAFSAGSRPSRPTSTRRPTGNASVAFFSCASPRAKRASACSVREQGKRICERRYWRRCR